MFALSLTIRPGSFIPSNAPERGISPAGPGCSNRHPSVSPRRFERRASFSASARERHFPLPPGHEARILPPMPSGETLFGPARVFARRFVPQSLSAAECALTKKKGRGWAYCYVGVYGDWGLRGHLLGESPSANGGASSGPSPSRGGRPALDE